MQWMMLQQDEPDDFVIATGVQFSVRQFIEKSATRLGFAIEWSGSGVDEIGTVASIDPSASLDLKTGDIIVRIDPRYFRPAEVETLLGDPSKAKDKLGWVPEITLDQLIDEMVAHDFAKAQQHKLLKAHGYSVAVSTEQ
jgi:GDPmannose 4,6-dehydratase